MCIVLLFSFTTSMLLFQDCLQVMRASVHTQPLPSAGGNRQSALNQFSGSISTAVFCDVARRSTSYHWCLFPGENPHKNDNNLCIRSYGRLHCTSDNTHEEDPDGFTSIWNWTNMKIEDPFWIFRVRSLR